MNTTTIVHKTLRVPRLPGPSGDGAAVAVARQLDAVLATAGFKAARDLLEHVSSLEPGTAMDLAVDVLAAIRALVGDHVVHNPYFLNFPHGVPDTVEFWLSCLRDALIPTTGHGAGAPTDTQLLAALGTGWVGLLDLPAYGRPRHSFAELLAAHDELIPAVKDRVTVLHLGADLATETRSLYAALAGSTTPLGEDDLVLLAQLVLACPEVEPAVIPVRENRAVLNAARLAAGRALLGVDTVVDVLRLACQASGGDPTLRTPTRFRSFARRERRVLMAALDQVVAGNEGKLGDVARRAGPFKRLGERLHPHEYPQHPHAQEVFAVARGERTVRGLAGRAELAFAAGDIAAAATALTPAPGMLMRSLDRLLRADTTPAARTAVLDAAATAVGEVSGRLLCSLREHLANRGEPQPARVFATRARRAWVTPDTRPPLPADLIAALSELIDAELARRLPDVEQLVVDPAVLDVALPLSGAATESGFAVLPRGSRTRVDGQLLRFFTYWRQREHRTDFDLSALLLDADFGYTGHVSWTRYHDGGGAVYSGDLTEAPDGATEFIDIPLESLDATYVVPQVNIYSGEGFDEVAESLFGWMLRDPAQAGAPFEPRTVRTRSDMRGPGRVALPILFGRGDDGRWTATWTHLYLPGSPRFNHVEGNRLTTATLIRAISERRYLTVGYLVDLLARAGTEVSSWRPGRPFPEEPVTFLGLHRPEELPAGSTDITVDRLNELIPD